MVPTFITDYLDQHHVAYTVYPHDRAPSPRAFARAMGVSGFRPVQVTPFRIDGALWLVAYDASSSLLPSQLVQTFSAEQLEPVAQGMEVFRHLEPGALPPLGQLWGADVVMDSALARDNDFVFRAGTYEDAVEIRAIDYFRIEHPMLANIATAPRGVDDPISRAMEHSADLAQGRTWSSLVP
jgi:Ala-tRNA(Pro) deacylase